MADHTQLWDYGVPAGAGEKEFSEFEEAKQYLIQQTTPLNYVLVQRSGTIKSGKLMIVCKHSRAYDNWRNLTETTRKRQRTTTKRSNCPFHLYVRQSKRDGRWRFTIPPGAHLHNHPRPQVAEIYPQNRQLTGEEEDEVRRHVEVGLEPKITIRLLRLRQPPCKATDRDIYNVIQRLRRAKLEAGSASSTSTNTSISSTGGAAGNSAEVLVEQPGS